MDDKSREDEYPEELLLEFKQEHERRVRMLTGITEEAQTHVLLLQASIDQRDFEISESRAFQAILPRYPAEEHAAVVDLTGSRASASAEGFFPSTAESISAHIQDILRRRPGGQRVKSLSVFALAPVPLLVRFGFDIGDIADVDLYQCHRDGQDWSWRQEDEGDDAGPTFYSSKVPDVEPGKDRPVALLLSVSAEVGRDRVVAILGNDAIVYELRANNPTVDFLRSRQRLNVFGFEMRKMLASIRDTHGSDEVIHLFAAVPSPAAIEFGRSLKQYDPPFMVYEFRKPDRTYFPALVVNEKSRQPP